MKHALAGATEECREAGNDVRRPIVCRGCRGVRFVRPVGGRHVRLRTSHAGIAVVLRRADVELVRGAGPVRSLRADAVALDGGGERDAFIVGGVEQSKGALVCLLDGGGVRFGGGVLRGGVHVFRGADGCDGHKGDRE